MILFKEGFVKDIIWAIRELCKGDKGFENMFDKAKSALEKRRKERKKRMMKDETEG